VVRQVEKLSFAIPAMERIDSWNKNGPVERVDRAVMEC